MTRILVVDHYDSFVFSLVDHLRGQGAEVELIEAADLTTDDLSSVGRADGVLLSPGPGRPEDVPISGALVHRAVAIGHPLLGVCLGHQVIAQALGGRVSEAPELVHGRTSAVHHRGDPIFAGLPSGFPAMRYHSLAVEQDSLPAELAVTAATADGVVMALRHRHAPVVGVQFHPESVLTEGGRRLLGNWLAEVGANRASVLGSATDSDR